MMCPSGPQKLSRRRNTSGDILPCSKQAFSDWSNVSTAVNFRLSKKPKSFGGGRDPVLFPVMLNSKILDKGMVPLAFDIDGKAAAEEASDPQFGGRPDVKDGPLFGTPYLEGVDGRTDYKIYNYKWFGAMRHNKQMTVAFIGGHVLSSADPVRESGWKWAYHPD
jgi:prepilin-type processing-associated H-X9-DG protein